MAKKIIPGHNDLASINPILASEWHPLKNNDLTPNNVGPKSGIKVWWLGSCGHEWEAKISNRGNGNGCPVCSGKKVLAGFNDLNTVAPILASEWHPSKNGELRPSNVTPQSNKSVMWQCKMGHEWQAAINNRYHLNQNCPYCSGRTAIPGVNDLATINPILASEWHPSKNGEITPQIVKNGSSGHRYWWLGKCGHEWQATVSNRTNGTGCPICAGKTVLLGFNDLSTTHPFLVKEWHPTKNPSLTPLTVSAGSNKRVWWLCRKGHEWSAVINHRANGTGCPLCANELQTSFPEQAILYYFQKITTAVNRFTELGKEIDIWLPKLRIGIEYNGYWHHFKEESDAMKVAFFADHNIRIITIKEGKENRIDGDVIEYVYSPNKDSLNWAISSLFILLNITFSIIDVENDSADIYDQYIKVEKERSFAIKYPLLTTEWHPTKNGKLNPDTISAHTDKKFWWLCSKCSYEWKATPLHRSQGTGCPVCANRKIKIGYNDLYTTKPELALEWHPTKNGDLTPQMVTAGSSAKKIWWKCSVCGNEWEATVAHRSKYNKCPACYKKSKTQ